MGKTLKNAKGKKYKPNSKEQQKKLKDKKRFHAKGSGQTYGDRGGWGGGYPKHLAKARKNPPPPFDEEL